MPKRSWLTKVLLFTLLLFAARSARSGGQTAAKPPSSAKAPGSTASATVTKTQPLDLNTAAGDQLKALPGIGDAYAKRIIDGRPYTAKNQLATRGVVPQSTYDKIKDSIVAHRPAKS